jgi:hypothetical protein
LSERWWVVGFTADAVVGGFQHTRLAEACAQAWAAAGRPPAVRIVETPGEGEHILHWYLNEAATALLDEHEVGWRSLLLGEGPAPPANGRDLVARMGAPS